jgi:hypothetical protein
MARHRMDTLRFELIQGPDACDLGSIPGMHTFPYNQIGLVVNTVVDREV